LLASDAIRFAIEELPQQLLVNTILEMQKRYQSEKIRSLYESEDYPLSREARTRWAHNTLVELIPHSSANPHHFDDKRGQISERTCGCWGAGRALLRQVAERDASLRVSRRTADPESTSEAVPGGAVALGARSDTPIDCQVHAGGD
jgi:hypothetical protein